MVSDEALADATGRTRAEWFKLLDKWGAAERSHKETAEHLQAGHGVDGWWAQAVTVEYERARGLRAVGQRMDGHFEASVQRTLAASASRVERALLDGGAALHDALATKPRASSTRQGRVLRFATDQARVEIVVTPLDDGRARVVVVQGALASAAARDEAKERWASALQELRARVEPQK